MYTFLLTLGLVSLGPPDDVAFCSATEQFVLEQGVRPRLSHVFPEHIVLAIEAMGSRDYPGRATATHYIQSLPNRDAIAIWAFFYGVARHDAETAGRAQSLLFEQLACAHCRQSGVCERLEGWLDCPVCQRHPVQPIEGVEYRYGNCRICSGTGWLLTRGGLTPPQWFGVKGEEYRPLTW